MGEEEEEERMIALDLVVIMIVILRLADSEEGVEESAAVDLVVRDSDIALAGK